MIRYKEKFETGTALLSRESREDIQKNVDRLSNEMRTFAREEMLTRGNIDWDDLAFLFPSVDAIQAKTDGISGQLLVELFEMNMTLMAQLEISNQDNNRRERLIEALLIEKARLSKGVGNDQS